MWEISSEFWLDTPMSSCSMEPIRAIIILLIPWGHGSIQSVTQFKSWTDFSHGNEVAYSCDQRLFCFLVNPASPRTSIIDKKKISSGTQGTLSPTKREKQVLPNAGQIVPLKLESKIIFDVVNNEVCSIFIYHFFAPNSKFFMCM